MWCVVFLNCLICLLFITFPISDHTWHGLATFFFLILLLSAVSFIFVMALLLLLVIILHVIRVPLCSAVWLNIRATGHTV